jgi:hypothetical protein
MKELYQDPVFEKSMTARLEQSRALLQELLDAWNALELRGCHSSSELFDLVHNPQQLVQEAVLLKESDTEGLTKQEAKEYQANLVFKRPEGFYQKSAEVRRDAFSNKIQVLFTIRDGQVIFQKPAFDEIVKSRSVFPRNENEKKAGEALLKLHELYNKVNRDTNGALGMHWNSLFVRNLRANAEADPVAIDVETFSTIIKSA